MNPDNISGSGVTRLKLGVLASHPIQYYAPLYRELAKECDLHVYFCHRQTAQGQADAGFGVVFDWDVDVLGGYHHHFLDNKARQPNVNTFFGCNTPQIADFIDKGDFDAFLVNGWYLWSFWQSIIACRRKGIPVLVRGDSQLATPRSKIKQALKALLYPVLLRQFAGCLYVGERNRAYLAHYGVVSSKLFFSPHCIDNDHFRQLSVQCDRGAFRKSLGIGENQTAVLFVGKFINKKRPADLVKAVALLKPQGLDICCVYAGSGPLSAQIESIATESNVPVHFLGFRNQSTLPEVYAGCDLLVLPSDGGETWGLVVNESLACGTPVVVSGEVGCGPDLVEESRTGATYPAGNIQALASAITRAMDIGRDALALRSKSDEYSIHAAARGILKAVNAITSKGKEHE